jgi:hypothetical protein
MSDRLADALAELAAPAEALRPDWHDVARRSRRSSRRAVLLGAAAGAVVLASAAFAVVPTLLRSNALAFMRTVSIEPTGAPAVVRRAFAGHRWAGTPRAAVSLRTSHGRAVLWVAPLRGRGWCEGLQLPRTRFTRETITCRWWSGSNGPFGGGFVGPALFEGRAAVTGGRELRLRFADGSSVRVPTRDGFYLYRVHERRLIRAEPRALVLRERGRAIGRFRLSTLYGGPLAVGSSLHRPGGVDLARARRVLSVRTRAGRVALFTAPSRLTSATCWWLWIRRGTYGSSCVGNRSDTTSLWSVAPLRVRVHGRELWLLWGRIGSDVGSLELRYQDGRRVPLARSDGYFLHVVRGPERVRGHRPALLVGRGPSGRVLRKELLLMFAWAPQR